MTNTQVADATQLLVDRSVALWEWTATKKQLNSRQWQATDVHERGQSAQCCHGNSPACLFISRHSCSAINIILIMYNWSFLSLCLTLSLESTPYFSPSTSSQSLLSLTCLFLLQPHPLTLLAHYSHHP